MRILLIEDDSATAKNLELLLKVEGFICDTTDLGEDGPRSKMKCNTIIALDVKTSETSGVAYEKVSSITI